jgi:hypothetical protein
VGSPRSDVGGVMRKRRHYSGILRRRLVLQESMSQQKKELKERWEALFKFYKIPDPFTDKAWKGLAEALAESHVPAFSYLGLQKRRPAGNKWKLSDQDIVEAVNEVNQLRVSQKLSMRRACEIVWKRNYKDICEYNAFRPNISQAAQIPINEMREIKPTDKPAVAKFKRAHLLEHRRGIELTLEEILGIAEELRAAYCISTWVKVVSPGERILRLPRFDFTADLPPKTVKR